jgi:hypothetical protein
MDERRRFSRVLFDAKAQLIQGDMKWETKVHDISLNGALTEEPTQFDPKDNFLMLDFYLPESDIELQMEVELVYRSNNQLGLRCVHIDIDSISHLRRMVELNLGQSTLLNRELEHFMDAHHN